MGTSVYPSNLDDFATTSPARLVDTDSTGRDHDARHDDLEKAVENIEAELGTTPSGVWATVAARLGELVTVTHPNTNDVLVKVYDQPQARWQLTHYDSGVRSIATALQASACYVTSSDATARVQRLGNMVNVAIYDYTFSTASSSQDVYTLPSGFRPSSNIVFPWFTSGVGGIGVWFASSGAFRLYTSTWGNLSSNARINYLNLSFATGDATPTSFTGTTLVSAALY